MTLGSIDRLAAVIESFEEKTIGRAHEREVEHVKPDDRIARKISVVVPSSLRGQHEIARRQDIAFAVDRRIPGAALDDEP